MPRDFNKLITWSQQFDFLPWRQKRSLYRTLVSEIMLQQTTVGTVLNKFEGFVELFPSITYLAQATEEEILVAWKGLGYYRRARNLLAAAKYIQTQYAGNIPKEYDQLVAIPGIGDYTASAILAIGDQQKYLAIDTNIERVLARYYGLDTEKGTKLKNTIAELFVNNEILNFKKAFRELNEAIMDLGREFCKTSYTNCDICPLHAGCKSVDNPLIRPVVTKKSLVTHELSLLRVLIIENNTLLSYRKNDNEWLAGQWECPTFVVKSNEILKQYPQMDYDHQHLKSFKTSITKYKISNYILQLSLEQFNTIFTWTRDLHPLAISNDTNFSTATQKALKLSEISY